MTKPDEVTVTREEAVEFLTTQAKLPRYRDGGVENTRQALAAFLAARVPDAEPPTSMTYAWGYNDCRATVLRGPG